MPQLGEPVVARAVMTPRPFAPVGDELGASQYAKMLRGRRLRDPGEARQLTDSMGADERLVVISGAAGSQPGGAQPPGEIGQREAPATEGSIQEGMGHGDD